MTLPRPLHRLLAAALIALLATALWPASATRVAAADDSNIPGVPLPGPVVTGQLGGPIYDHVYQFDVPPASVVLLSLSGDPSSDFGMYLFDSSATTIFRLDGQVAESAQPGPTQSITYPTINGGRYYVDLNGANDVQGQFRLVVAIEHDTTPPGAELRLDGGAAATADQTVRVTLIGTDDLSGVDSMQLSVDGSTFGAFVPYTPTFLWSFSPEDGTKELWARVRDRAGNVSAVASAIIELDTVAPTVVTRTPGPNDMAPGLRPTFSVTFDEPIDPATWVHQGLVVQQVDGSTVPGTYTWSQATRTGTFVPEVALTAGQPVTCSLSGITDLAGNPLAQIGTWVVTPLTQHTISLQAATPIVTTGGSATFQGRVDGPVAGAITLQDLEGSTWVPIVTLQPTLAGTFTTHVPVTQNTWYRVHVESSATEAASSSAAVRIVARRGLVLAGYNSSKTTPGKKGSVVKVVAKLAPALPAMKVTLTVSRFNSSRHTWVKVTTLQQTSNSAGAAPFSWRPASAGTYQLRLTTATTPDFGNGVSSAYTWSIK